MKLQELQITRGKQGIYFLYNINREIIYIGQSKNIYIRLLEHLADGKKDFSYYKFASNNDITYVELMETYLINKYSNDGCKLLNKLILNITMDTFYNFIPSCIKNKYPIEIINKDATALVSFFNDKYEMNCSLKKQEIEDLDFDFLKDLNA